MKRLLLILFTIQCSLFTAFAQCGIENTAFKSGEELDYDLYFNWKFVWVKVGSASIVSHHTRQQQTRQDVHYARHTAQLL